ncbi:MAG: metal-dependent phosphohydrolase [Gammaproteobacteria bacterium]
MLDLNQILVNEVSEKLETTFHAMFGGRDLEYLGVAKSACAQALMLISECDALYHNTEHTARVTLVGLQVLLGKQTAHHDVSPAEWLNTVVSMVCHDIGYVRGICPADQGPTLATGIGHNTTDIACERSDAALMPIHVDRGKAFVGSNLVSSHLIDELFVQSCIERTRFPVPTDSWYAITNDYPGLVRGADLIGQLSDPTYLSKLPAIFYEFVEVGFNDSLGYRTPGDLLTNYPKFFSGSVKPYIRETEDLLNQTVSGREILAALYKNLDDAAKPQPEFHRARSTG